jgi:hypothetical protein
MDPDKVTLDTLIDNIKLVLKKCLISSPVYGNLQRQLAEYLFESNKPLEGVVQLVESLGGKYKFDHLKLEQEYVLSGGAKNEENIQNYENVKVRFFIYFEKEKKKFERGNCPIITGIEEREEQLNP